MINLLEMTQEQWDEMVAAARAYIAANAELIEALKRQGSFGTYLPQPGLLTSFAEVEAYQKTCLEQMDGQNRLNIETVNAAGRCLQARLLLYGLLPTNTWVLVDDYKIINDNDSQRPQDVKLFRGGINTTARY